MGKLRTQQEKGSLIQQSAGRIRTNTQVFWLQVQGLFLPQLLTAPPSSYHTIFPLHVNHHFSKCFSFSPSGGIRRCPELSYRGRVWFMNCLCTTVPLLRRDWEILSLKLKSKESLWIWKSPDTTWEMRTRAWVQWANHERLTGNEMSFKEYLGLLERKARISGSKVGSLRFFCPATFFHRPSTC